MSLPRFIRQQLANPAGLIGRLILNRLNKANRGMNELPLSLLPLSSVDRVLEIGFGGGALLRMILREGPSSVVGVEMSDLAIKVIRRRHRQAVDQGKLKLVRSDASAMPFKDGEFSKIYCVNVIYFWPEPDQVFRELSRATAAPGHLALCYQQYGPDEAVSYSSAQVEQSLICAGFTSAETTTAQDKSNDRYFCTIASKAAAHV